MLTPFHLAGRPSTGVSGVGCGAMAQLVARLHGMQKVRGSNPLSSTDFRTSGRFSVTFQVTVVWDLLDSATITLALPSTP